jgi:hypothetical protein
MLGTKKRKEKQRKFFTELWGRILNQEYNGVKIEGKCFDMDIGERLRLMMFLKKRMYDKDFCKKWPELVRWHLIGLPEFKKWELELEQ